MTGALLIRDTLLNSGCHGLTLSKLLAEQYPTARRAEAFLGAALAVTELQAELMIAQAEIEALRWRATILDPFEPAKALAA